MRLVVDGQGMQIPGSRSRGMGRYARNLLLALAAARPHWQIDLIQNEQLDPLDPLPAGSPITVRSFVPPLPRAGRNSDPNERYYADWLLDLRPTAALVPSLFDPSGLMPMFTGPRPPVLGVVYDLIPLLFQPGYMPLPGDVLIYGRRFRAMLALDAVLAISEATAQDVRRFGYSRPEAVVNIRGAALDSIRPHSAEEVGAYRKRFRRRYGIDKDFILYVGAFEWRKNPVGTMEAFALLPEPVRSRLDLVITCRMAKSEERVLREEARHLGIARSLKITGYVPDDELRALYQLCRLLLFPSYYEGLGLPVLEALACGTPVVTSNTSSLPEYAGDVCRLANPASPEALAQAVEEALAEPREAGAEARRAFAAQFTWEDTARRAAAAIESAVSDRGAVTARPRIAWVSPGWPEPCLGPHYDVDFIVESAPSGGSMLIGASELARRHEARPYDLFIHHLADDPAHAYVLSFIVRYRGVVVLHDEHLEKLLATAAVSQWLTRLPPVQGSSAASGATQLLIDRIAPYCTAVITSPLRCPEELMAAGIEDRRVRDCLWLERACDALAASEAPTRAGRLIEAWAALRQRVRQHYAGRPPREPRICDKVERTREAE
jgi:glycosyltransferase involved in cell wall biosynthesis